MAEADRCKWCSFEKLSEETNREIERPYKSTLWILVINSDDDFVNGSC